MSELAKEYLDNFLNLTSTITVTNRKEERLDIYQGIEDAINIINISAECGKKLIFIGNGASASISSHMSTDFWKNGVIKAIAFNDSSLLTCISNDFGYKHVFEKPVEMFAEKGDVLVAISSSGQSENIIRAVNAALANNCVIITLTGFERYNPLSLLGDLNFYVPSSEYGPVETIHQLVCHWILDCIIAKHNNE